MATSFAAKPGTPVPPWVVALLAPGDAPVAAETRVRGLDAGAGVDDRPAGGESRGRRWENGASYDAKASGSTQFLSRDPLASMTGAPYAYVDDNPLNNTDPSGLCPWNPTDCPVIGGALSAVGHAAGAVGGAVGSQVVSWAGDIHNGGLPNGHCIMLIQNNCESNVAGNAEALHDVPVVGHGIPVLGGLYKLDPFVSLYVDKARQLNGDCVSNGEIQGDILGAFLTPAGAALGQLPARIAGPIAGNWAAAAGLWNLRTGIGVGLNSLLKHLLG